MTQVDPYSPERGRPIEDAVEGVTGLKVNTCAMLDLKGFAHVVTVIGGLRVNLADPVKTSLTRPPPDLYRLAQRGGQRARRRATAKIIDPPEGVRPQGRVL